MYLNVGKIFALVEVSHEYKLVVLLKELFKGSTSTSLIFSDGGVQVLIPEIIFHEESL